MSWSLHPETCVLVDFRQHQAISLEVFRHKPTDSALSQNVDLPLLSVLEGQKYWRQVHPVCCSPPWIKPLFRGSSKAADHSPPVALNGFKTIIFILPFPLPTCDNQQACSITSEKALVTVCISDRSHKLSIPCYLEMKATDSPQATDPGPSPTDPSADPPTDPSADPPTDPSTNPSTDPPVNPPTDPPTYFSTDPYLVPSLESSPLGRFLVPHGLVPTPPQEIPEVRNRSGRTSLTRWTRDGTYIPGGRESYISATDNPPPYSEDLEKHDDHEGRKDEGKGDDSWLRKHKADVKWTRDYKQGDIISEGDGEKRQNKTPIACNFCRIRKLKCSGSRPSCHNCTNKGESCVYKEVQRRRGPGRKNKGLPPRAKEPQQEIDKPPEASTSKSTTSTFTSQHQPSSSYHPQAPLPGPPIPQYNYDLGQIQSSSGTVSRSGESSSSREPHRYDGNQLYPQPEYTRPPEHGDYAHQLMQEQYHRRFTAHEHQRSQPSHLYRDEYSQASTSRVDFHSGPLAERQSLHPSEVGDNEGTSRPRSKRRRISSPPEDIGPSNPKQRRYYDPDEEGD